MNKRIRFGILGGLAGVALGIIGGAFLGLVIGGTYFGWVELSRYPGLTGYEIGAYTGVVIGILAATPLGSLLGLRHAGRTG